MARRRSFGGEKKRNYYDWEGATLALTTLAAAAVVEFSLFVGDKSETFVRLRGQVLAQLDASGSTAGDACVIAAGIMVAPTGATLAVDPINEPGANWMWHQYLTLQTEGIVGGVAEQGDLSGQVVMVDNKAMRKIREDESVFLVVANQNLVGGPSVKFTGAFRMLAQS